MKTEYIVDGSKLVRQISTVAGIDVILTFYYSENDELVGFNYNNHDHWYGKDINGVIRYIYNETGTICAEYTYDAWGRVISATNLNGGTVAGVNPFR